MTVEVAPNQMKWIYVRIKTAYKINAIIGITETRRPRAWSMIGKSEEADSITEIIEGIVPGLRTGIIVLGQGIIDPDLGIGHDRQ